ncbi:hypothetical protein HK405_007297, partial [Cladochytrium tenue]
MLADATPPAPATAALPPVAAAARTATARAVAALAEAAPVTTTMAMVTPLAPALSAAVAAAAAEAAARATTASNAAVQASATAAATVTSLFLLLLPDDVLEAVACASVVLAAANDGPGATGAAAEALEGSCRRLRRVVRGSRRVWRRVLGTAAAALAAADGLPPHLLLQPLLQPPVSELRELARRLWPGRTAAMMATAASVGAARAPTAAAELKLVQVEAGHPLPPAKDWPPAAMAAVAAAAASRRRHRRHGRPVLPPSETRPVAVRRRVLHVQVLGGQGRACVLRQRCGFLFEAAAAAPPAIAAVGEGAGEDPISSFTTTTSARWSHSAGVIGGVPALGHRHRRCVFFHDVERGRTVALRTRVDLFSAHVVVGTDLVLDFGTGGTSGGGGGGNGGHGVLRVFRWNEEAEDFEHLAAVSAAVTRDLLEGLARLGLVDTNPGGVGGAWWGTVAVNSAGPGAVRLGTRAWDAVLVVASSAAGDLGIGGSGGDELRLHTVQDLSQARGASRATAAASGAVVASAGSVVVRDRIVPLP